MTYALNALGIGFFLAFIVVFCFVLDRALGTVLFHFYYALHLASNRDRFVRAYSYFSRALGGLIIVGVTVGVVLRVAE